MGLRQQVGQRLREVREVLGISQDEAGHRAGISGKYVGRLERGEVAPTVETLDRLCKALHTNIPDLLTPRITTAADDRQVLVHLVKKIVDDGDDRQVAKLRALIEIFTA